MFELQYSNTGQWWRKSLDVYNLPSSIYILRLSSEEISNINVRIIQNSVQLELLSTYLLSEGPCNGCYLVADQRMLNARQVHRSSVRAQENRITLSCELIGTYNLNCQSLNFYQAINIYTVHLHHCAFVKIKICMQKEQQGYSFENFFYFYCIKLVCSIRNFACIDTSEASVIKRRYYKML